MFARLGVAPMASIQPLHAAAVQQQLPGTFIGTSAAAALPAPQPHQLVGVVGGAMLSP